jgi:hypothetical protein
MPKKRYSIKLPPILLTGKCSVCGEKAFHRFSNRGWNGKEFCPNHLAEGEEYWRQVNAENAGI